MPPNIDSPNIFHHRWISKNKKAKFNSAPLCLERINQLDELIYSNAFWKYDYFSVNRF